MKTIELINQIAKIQNLINKEDSIFLTKNRLNVTTKLKNGTITVTHVKEN